MTVSVRLATLQDREQLASLFDGYRRSMASLRISSRALCFCGQRPIARASRAPYGLKLSTEITNLSAQHLYTALGWKCDEEFYEYGLAF